MNNRFISCDWGTSSFRIRLIDAGTLSVAGELRSDQGIAATFELWKKTGKSEEGRLPFYRSILEARIGDLEQQSRIRRKNS
jgi:2-dehydro-3-deoxygalactonokinase